MTPQELVDGLRHLKSTGTSWYKMSKDLKISYQTLSNWRNNVYEPAFYYRPVVEKYLKKNAIDLVARS